MFDTEQEQKMIQIEFILEEASLFNLRSEVFEMAQKELRENPEMEIVEAYQTAFAEWVK